MLHHRYVDLNYQLPGRVESKLKLMIIRQIEASIFLTLDVQIPYMSRQFVASVFGHQLVVSIHDYLVLLLVTTNNSNCFLDPICAVQLEVSRQFVASVFGIHL